MIELKLENGKLLGAIGEALEDNTTTDVHISITPPVSITNSTNHMPNSTTLAPYGITNIQLGQDNGMLHTVEGITVVNNGAVAITSLRPITISESGISLARNNGVMAVNDGPSLITNNSYETKESLLNALRIIIERAERGGFILEIDKIYNKPLAMGNYQMTANVYKKFSRE